MFAKWLAIISTVAALVPAFAQGDGITRTMRIDPKQPPFSFSYGGRDFSSLRNAWNLKTHADALDPNRTRQSFEWLDPETGLDARCVEVRYRDPAPEVRNGISIGEGAAVEWTVYLKNTGKSDTPIIENLQGLDVEFERRQQGDFLLHHNVGSPATGDDYAPIETPMPPHASKRVSGAGGRPTSSDLSYFNLEYGGRGTIIVVGWPGQWAANFQRDSADGLRVTAGQELTHFKLHPGEEVRTPLIVLLNWQGDWMHGQNLWRRWMMAYGMPKPGGKLPSPMLLASSGRAYREMIGANEANQIMHIDRYLEEGIKIDYWWMDAGWYIQDEGWPQVGTWEVDPKRFPGGFKPISDHAHRKGVKILVWFEPERVAPGTWLAENHPEWLLSPLGGLVVKHSSRMQTTEPCVVFNNAEHSIDSNGIHWEPRSLSFHPGPKGEYSVVRFTAPSAGEYQVDATFTGIDQKTTTDVHVLHSGARVGESLFNSLILLNGHGRLESFKKGVPLEKGDTLDFVVGYGNGTYFYDSTGLQAVVNGPDGKPHDAAKEYDAPNGLWSYGFLSPSSAPDPATFQPYDREEKAGANANRLFNLGDSKAWHWLVNHISGLLTKNGIDLYRQDFNIDPLWFWRGNDAPDRQGITENKYVVGYLAYWDELRRRHPNMLIDSCASGGRRNDLETMRRAVPLWRSDYAYEPIGHQGMTYGISMWLPYHGTGTVADENAPYYGGGVTPVHPYAFWSNTAPSLGLGVDIREKGIDYETLRRLISEWRSIWPYYYGDYYPLTPYSHRDDNWIAWQFNRPEQGDGIVEAFRRPKAGEESVRLKLFGLAAAGQYKITVVDGADGFDRDFSGRELMETGLRISVRDKPGAAVVRYLRT